MKTRRDLAPICVALFASGIAVAQESQQPVQFHIEAQPIRLALQQFGQQAGLQVAMRLNGGPAEDMKVPAVSGALTAQAALETLLKGTGLKYEFVNDRAVRISAEGDSPKNNETPDTGAALNNTTSKNGFWQRFRLAQADKTSTSTMSASEGSASGHSSGQLEEIVVTAQKREERLQDVPISMSVLSGEQLDTSSAQGVSEMLNRVPGVIATEANPSGATQLQVRGVGASLAVFSGSSPVGYYLDSVPFGLTLSAILPDTNAYDMNRVEVLRGPQGTLYGANSMAGVVRVLPHDADLETFEFKGRALTSSTEGGSGNYRGDLAVNVPLVEGKLAARLVAGYQSLSGWLDKPIERNANDAEISNLRMKINAEPNDQLSVGASIWRSRADFGAPSTGRDNQQRGSFVDEPMSTDFDAYGLKVEYDFSGFSLISMTSYLDYLNDSYADFGAGLGTVASNIFRYYFPANVFAQEFNLISTSEGPWRWTVGGIYRDETDETRYFFPRFFTQIARNVYASESFAVFGELTRTFLDGRFELTGGLRYFEDHVKQTERSTFSGAPAFGLYADETFDSTAPRIVLSWHPDDQATVYASYGTGFRSGISQNLTILRANPNFRPVEPDTLDTYEVGAKGSLWGGRLNFDSALYYLDWQDIQQQVSLFDPAISEYLSALINSESASGPGFDFGISAELVKGLTLGATFSVNDLAMDNDVFSGGIVLFSKGDRPNLSPKRTISASLDYVVPLGSNGYEGRFSASANYVSPQTTRSLGGAPGSPMIAVVEGDTMVVSRASVSIGAPAGWTATVFADNITNEDGFPYISIATARLDEASRIRPRTIGVQVDYRFGRR